MKNRKWKNKNFAVVRPRRGQKFRLAQLCDVLSRGQRPPAEMLADVFGISSALIYQARWAARPHGCGNGHVRPAKGNGQHPIVRPTITPPVMPTPAVEPVKIPSITDPCSIAEELVHMHGVDRVFDRLIMPAIS